MGYPHFWKPPFQGPDGRPLQYATSHSRWGQAAGDAASTSFHLISLLQRDFQRKNPDMVGTWILRLNQNLDTNEAENLDVSHLFRQSSLVGEDIMFGQNCLKSPRIDERYFFKLITHWHLWVCGRVPHDLTYTQQIAGNIPSYPCCGWFTSQPILIHKKNPFMSRSYLFLEYILMEVS